MFLLRLWNKDVAEHRHTHALRFNTKRFWCSTCKASGPFRSSSACQIPPVSSHLIICLVFFLPWLFCKLNHHLISTRKGYSPFVHFCVWENVWTSRSESLISHSHAYQETQALPVSSLGFGPRCRTRHRETGGGDEGRVVEINFAFLMLTDAYGATRSVIIWRKWWSLFSFRSEVGL